MISDLGDLDARDALLAVEEARRREMSAQADTLALAAHWCDLHAGNLDFDDQARVLVPGEGLVGIGGDGSPLVEEFAAAEFGAMRHQHPMASRSLMADALDLRHRLVRVWQAMQVLEIESWLARKIASMTRKLDRRAAAHVDEAIAPYLESLPAGRLLALVEAKIVEADPDLEEQQRKACEETRFVRSTNDGHGLKVLIARATAGDVLVFEAMVARIAEILGELGDDDHVEVRRSRAIGILGHPAEALRMLLNSGAAAGVPDELTEEVIETDPTKPSLRALLNSVDPAATKPPARLFAHIAGGDVARVEGLGPITVDQLREWLRNFDVTVTPVLDLADQRPVDGYEFPARIREAAHQLHPADPFPWSVNTSRRRDGDHCTPYVPMDHGGLPGQTALDNCALLGRHHHRIKTFGHWHLTCLSPGRYLWTSPHGFRFLVDHNGTRRVKDCTSDSPLEQKLARLTLAA